MLKNKTHVLLALALILASHAKAEDVTPSASAVDAKTELEMKLPEESRQRLIYVGGMVGSPYALSTSSTGGNPLGASYSLNAGAIPLKNLSVGGFFNQNFAYGSASLARADKRFGIEASYLMPSFESWSLALGYRLGIVQVMGVTPFFTEGYDIMSIGHGPKVSLHKRLSDSFALGYEVGYFVFSNPQAGSTSVFGNQAGPALQSIGMIDANLSFIFFL